MTLVDITDDKIFYDHVKILFGFKRTVKNHMSHCYSCKKKPVMYKNGVVSSTSDDPGEGARAPSRRRGVGHRGIEVPPKGCWFKDL